MICSIIYLNRKKFIFTFTLKNLRIDRDRLKELSMVGIPISSQECMVRLSFLYLTSVTNRLGVNAAAAVGIASKYDVFAMLPATSIASALAAITAQNYGCLLYTSVAYIPAPLKCVLMTDSGLIANHHIKPAKQNDSHKIHRRQIPDNPLGNHKIDTAWNYQKADYQGKKENHNLPDPSGVVQSVIKSGATPGRHPVLLKHCPHLDLQVPVVFPQLAGFLGNPLLYPLAFGLLPFRPCLPETFLSFSNLLVIAGINLIQTPLNRLIHGVRHSLLGSLQLPLFHLFLIRQLAGRILVLSLIHI